MQSRLLPALLCLLALSACNTHEPAEDWPAPSPALWAIESSDGRTEGWLFGTIHALPDDVEWRTPALERAIEESGWLAMEISLDDQNELSSIFGELSTTPSQPPLLERVGAEYRDELAALLDKTGHDSDDFTSTETWAAALTLAQATSSGETENGVDKALSREFHAFLILEGARKQLSIFDALPAEEQQDLLEAVAAESTERSSADAFPLVKAWLTGDMERLEEETTHGMLADPELRAALLTDRNREWVDTIDVWMKRDDPILVAAGAAHMAGEEGLPSLLRDRGYIVRRLQ